VRTRKHGHEEPEYLTLTAIVKATGHAGSREQLTIADPASIPLRRHLVVIFRSAAMIAESCMRKTPCACR